MTDECLASSKGAEATLTRTVTGAIFVSHETQRLVVSDKTGICSSAWPGRASAGLLTTDSEMVTPLFDSLFCILGKNDPDLISSNGFTLRILL
jgi:hypothetical protein